MTEPTLNADSQPELMPQDARQALEEVNDAAIATETLLNDDAGIVQPVASDDDSVRRQITEEEVQALRARANRQRERGQKSLAKRHDGVASLIRDVKINERVVASAFERFFPVIEAGIHIIEKRGEMFLTPSALEAVNRITIEKIEELEKTVAADFAAVEIQLNVHSGRDDFVRPQYIAPAATHQVQLRHILANRVLNVFLRQDQIIAGLQTLNWNGESDAGSIEDQEFQHKRKVRALATHIGRTLRGMRNKFQAAAPVATQPVEVAEAA